MIFMFIKKMLNKMELPDIKVERKTGKEKFEFNNEKLDFELSEFWSWN